MTNRGMTLLEIMVVVVLVALLATLAGPQIFEHLRWGSEKVALTRCKEMHDAVHLHRMQHPGAPAPRTLADVPGLDRTPDPWGSPYRLETDSGRIRVWSNGPDGIEGSDDDICYVPRDEGA